MLEQIQPSRRCATPIWAALCTIGPMIVGCSAPGSSERLITSTGRSDRGAARLVTTVEGITEYELTNGLRVLLYPDQSKATFTVNVTYLVGSRHEGRGETGMAHLLEHMVFKGTDTYPNIWGALEDHGASFNASTWVDRTNYFETLPASEENLRFALSMEADRMVNSRISADDLASEMTVVRNEFEMGENNPVGILSERMLSAAYLWHNYGKSTIGNRSDIERVPVDSLKRFYEKYYQPDNAVLVVAGKFEPEATLDLINSTFGAIPRPDRVLEETYTEEPAQDGQRFVTLERVGDVAATGAVYHIPAGSHEDYAAIRILQQVLTSQPSGRLYKALVEAGLAARVRGSAFSWAEPGVLRLMAEVRLDQDVRAAHDRMIETTENVADTVTKAEVDRARERILKFNKLAMTNSGRIGVRLSESVAIGDWRMFFIQRDRIKKVTTDDVRRVAREYLVAGNRTSGVFTPIEAPSRATIPATPDVSQIVEGYKGTETIDLGEVFVATPDNLDARTKRSTLDNGIKVALLSKETRGNAVTASFAFHFGSEGALTGHTAALQLVPAMLMRGTTKRDYQQLRDEIDRLQSTIRVSGGVGMASASITTDRENFTAAIALLGEIMSEPAFPADEFDIIVRDRLASLEEQLSDPRARGSIFLARAMSPWPTDSIHYVPTIEERIDRLKSVSLGSLRDLYTRFYGASNLEVSIVGDFDEQEVAEAMNRAFGSWKSPARYTRIVEPYRANIPADETIDTPDKQMAMVTMGMTLKLRDDDPDYPALEFANYILGSSAKSRLLNRLRHKGGLSYGAGSRLRVDDQDTRGSLTAFAICAPQNVVKAQRAMREEISRWIDQGITEEELEDGKNSFALKFQNRLASDRFVVGRLCAYLETGRTFEHDARKLAAIQALTVADVRDVLKRRFEGAEFTMVKAGDMAQVEQ